MLQDLAKVQEIQTGKVNISALSEMTDHDRKTIRKYLSKPLDYPHQYRHLKAGKLNPFKGYLESRIEQFPEAIFCQVNENFYRTTFYKLCSRYLSTWFTWNIERSYPEGRSDLEFVGKYHERFANLRWVIEFKYFSKNEFSKMKCKIEDIPLREEDTRQIQGYAQGLMQEYPEASIRLFVIYCIGNQGFRIFEI